MKSETYLLFGLRESQGLTQPPTPGGVIPLEAGSFRSFPARLKQPALNLASEPLRSRSESTAGRCEKVGSQDTARLPQNFPLAGTNPLLSSAVQQRLKILTALAALAAGLAISGLAIWKVAATWSSVPTLTRIQSSAFRQ